MGLTRCSGARSSPSGYDINVWRIMISIPGGSFEKGCEGCRNEKCRTRGSSRNKREAPNIDWPKVQYYVDDDDAMEARVTCQFSI